MGKIEWATSPPHDTPTFVTMSVYLRMSILHEAQAKQYKIKYQQVYTIDASVQKSNQEGSI